jgi:UDP:flavonoid glycosyltransferase YjiC (YdhE family)
MIEVGGMHIRPKRNPLPENMKAFIESSKNGCIYFSLGSNLKSAQLPIEKRDAILRVFSKLNLNVLWKWEDENLPGKPNNVFISKWFPQDDILAHPNIKLFITHGGLLSTTEATYYGVPVIGIPIFGDQQLNMERTKRAGYGLVVPYNELNEEKLSNALNQILSNPKFGENAKVVSSRYHDQPLKPLEMAVYWVEYVCRHKGAPHLHSAGQNLNTIQYHNLDIFGMIILLLLLVDYILYRIFRAIFSKHKKPVPSSAAQTKNNKKVKKN